ncbi:SDR family oxidoreductase [Sporichthya sp.]|uniref:SDR family oxidoreductase n=1 Tax=Sporichthya sp. TaxID=65475 RepID=UPI0017DFF475|nr:SDR family oxidoreductase [Sporichthya sp.]MBA3744392.1 SDR family oxidoreductase [Sporichthya sp.]
MGTQRTALITGGASGIGLTTAARLRDEGFDVVIADLDPNAPEVAAELGVTAQALDVTSVEAWERLGAALDAAEVELGALVLNAGIAGGGTDLAGLDLERYHRLMRVNVDGVIYGLRTMLPRLARPGVVTVTASLAGLMGVPADPVYAMTKHAVIGLVRSSAAELAAQGVRIHAICPGFVETPLLGAAKAQLDAAAFPLLTTDEIAAAIADLITGRSTAQVTVLQPGRKPVDYAFAGIPGPRMLDGAKAPDLPTELNLG